MTETGRRPRIRIAGTLVTVLAVLAISQFGLDRLAGAQNAQTPQAPRFEVDPLWPKPMPNNWVFGQTIGLGISSDDHVWIIHRGNDPQNLDRTEYAQPNPNGPRVSECCNPAPPVVEFDAAGNQVGAWGGPVKGRGSLHFSGGYSEQVAIAS